jgi:hypothetical protein
VDYKVRFLTAICQPVQGVHDESHVRGIVGGEFQGPKERRFGARL